MMSIKTGECRDVPGGPGVKTPPSTARGAGSILVGELRSHRPCSVPPPPEIKKERKGKKKEREREKERKKRNGEYIRLFLVSSESC